MSNGTSIEIWNLILGTLFTPPMGDEDNLKSIIEKATQRVENGESVKEVAVETVDKIRLLTSELERTNKRLAVESRRLLAMKDADFTEALGVGRSTFALIRKERDNELF